MTKTIITFRDLRKMKDSLPDGSMHRIADELGIPVETVRNYFGGQNYKEGNSCGVHLEAGPEGGVVSLDDSTILDLAKKILEENSIVLESEEPAKA